MIDFYQTQMGKKFFCADIPNLIKSVNRLADALETRNRIDSVKLDLPVDLEEVETENE